MIGYLLALAGIVWIVSVWYVTRLWTGRMDVEPLVLAMTGIFFTPPRWGRRIARSYPAALLTIGLFIVTAVPLLYGQSAAPETRAIIMKWVDLGSQITAGSLVLVVTTTCFGFPAALVIPALRSEGAAPDGRA